MTHKFFKLTSIAATCIGLLAACQTTSESTDTASVKQPMMFEEALTDFPRAEKNLREWDTPVVADLDQDGYPDLLLNDHGFAVRVMWNNKGTYAKPYDLIMGDMHGISVADFDKDGNNELVISRGGGSGSNARNSIIYRVDRERNFTVLPDFKEPLAFMRGRTVKFVDVNNNGELDLLNFAFPDSKKKGESESYVYKNDGKGSLSIDNVLPPVVRGDGQKTLITDFTGDNIVDILIYGNGHVKAFEGQADLTFKQVEDKLFSQKYFHVNNIAEIDYDNDGDFDLVLSRGKEFFAGETFYDEETQTWGFYTKRGTFEFEGLEIGEVLNVENLQSQWPNKTLFLGESAYEYAYPGETHSGRDIRLVNSDTLGFPDKTEEKGTYIGYVGNQQWNLTVNMFSPSTGIFHGVKSAKAYPHEKGLSNIILENRNGKYVDVSVQVGLSLEENTTGVAVADIDNNGHQDLVFLKRGNLVKENESLVYLNNGDKTFELKPVNGMISKELGAIGMGVEPVDYNLDGQVDFVQGNERGKWHLFKNTSEVAASNNHLIVNVGNQATSNTSPLGALVNVTACGNSQTKRLGATGAAYSLSYDKNVHFGLGNCQEKAKVTVTWSDNTTQQLTADKVNTVVVAGKA